jgi:hypothetical protein
MKKHLPADADRLVWIVTASLVAFGALLLALVGGIRSMPVVAEIILYGIAGIVALVLYLGWLAKPLRYEVRDDSVTLIRSRPFAGVTIPKSAIKEMRHLKLGQIKPVGLSIGWVFGYAGRFQSGDLGEIMLFGTNPEHAVLIHADETYVFTPSNPKRFMHDISGKK